MARDLLGHTSYTRPDVHKAATAELRRAGVKRLEAAASDGGPVGLGNSQDGSQSGRFFP